MGGHENTEALIDLLMLTGQMLLENGAETYRVETSILIMYRALGGGGEINVVALATQLSMDISNGGHFTVIRRIRRRGVNLKKFARVNDISRSVSHGDIGAAEALRLLRELDSIKKRYKLLQAMAAASLVTVMFVFMIGGGVFEAAVAFVGCLIVQTCWIFIKRMASLIFVAHIISGFLITLIAAAGAYLLGLSLERIVFGAMLPLFPGVAMVIAILDTVNGDLNSGVARGVEAVLTAAGLALGASLALICVPGAWGISSGLQMVAMMDLPYAGFAMLVSFGSGLMLSAHIKTSAGGAVIGGVVYAIFLLCGGSAVGVFVASLTLAALSEIAARILKEPSTLFLITGIYPLVPGAGIYSTAALIMQRNAEASVTGVNTVAELLFMVAGIAIVSTLFKLKFTNTHLKQP